MRLMISIIVFVGLLTLIAVDARFHFNEERVILKRQHQSAQRHWSLFYKQNYIYEDSLFKYRKDIDGIEKILEPNNVLISDKASSYYLASELPVYVKNVQPHHLRHAGWNKIFNERYLCYIELEEALEHTKNFIERQTRIDKQLNKPEIKYWLVNRDLRNLNMRYDCLANRGSRIIGGLDHLGELIYQGEYLWLYELDYRPTR